MLLHFYGAMWKMEQTSPDRFAWRMIDSFHVDFFTISFLLFTKKWKFNSHKIRGTGKVEELNETEIAEFYKIEPLFARIRSRICECGARVDWDELKAKHDQVFSDYQNSKDNLPQGDN